VVFSALFAAVLASFRNLGALQLELLALRHQLGVLHRSARFIYQAVSRENFEKLADFSVGWIFR
jgi:hypothetical protein